MLNLVTHAQALRTRAANFRDDKKGVTALEYALVAGVIVVTITVGFQALATAISGAFVTIGGLVTSGA